MTPNPTSLEKILTWYAGTENIALRSAELQIDAQKYRVMEGQQQITSFEDPSPTSFCTYIEKCPVESDNVTGSPDRTENSIVLSTTNYSESETDEYVNNHISPLEEDLARKIIKTNESKFPSFREIVVLEKGIIPEGIGKYLAILFDGQQYLAYSGTTQPDPENENIYSRMIPDLAEPKIFPDPTKIMEYINSEIKAPTPEPPYLEPIEGLDH